MSRVHDALRRAEQGAPPPTEPAPEVRQEAPRLPEFLPLGHGPASARISVDPASLSEVVTVAFNPAPESHLLDLNTSHETPAE
jgi:receptor protein-tyrosine kinase